MINVTRLQNTVTRLLKKELDAQGHYLTGRLEKSIQVQVLKGFLNYEINVVALDYAKFLNDGFPAESASMKQFPFLVHYFLQRGLSLKPAQQAAAATIITWQRDGMPSQHAGVYSKSDERQHFIENVFINHDAQILKVLEDDMDYEINKEYLKTGSDD